MFYKIGKFLIKSLGSYYLYLYRDHFRIIDYLKLSNQNIFPGLLYSCNVQNSESPSILCRIFCPLILNRIPFDMKMILLSTAKARIRDSAFSLLLFIYISCHVLDMGVWLLIIPLPVCIHICMFVCGYKLIYSKQHLIGYFRIF